MSHIRGEWFHCAYCPKDLCDSCAEVDTHDNMHLFVVFKAEVNMGIFRCVLLSLPPSLPPRNPLCARGRSLEKLTARICMCADGS